MMYEPRIKELRTALNLTQEELGKKLNIEQSTIGSYEVGNSKLSIDRAIEFAKFFNCSVDYLIGRENEEGIIINNNLSNYENNLIELTRNLDEKNKILIIKFAEFLNNK